MPAIVPPRHVFLEQFRVKCLFFQDRFIVVHIERFGVCKFPNFHAIATRFRGDVGLHAELRANSEYHKLLVNCNPGRNTFCCMTKTNSIFPEWEKVCLFAVWPDGSLCCQTSRISRRGWIVKDSYCSAQRGTVIFLRPERRVPVTLMARLEHTDMQQTANECFHFYDIDFSPKTWIPSSGILRNEFFREVICVLRVTLCVMSSGHMRLNISMIFAFLRKQLGLLFDEAHLYC